MPTTLKAPARGYSEHKADKTDELMAAVARLIRRG